jgi:hypothetical protein
MTNDATWTARVEWTTDRERTEDELFDIIERLAGKHPVVGMDRTTPPGEPKRPTIMLNLKGMTLRQAVGEAISAVESAVGEKAVGIEVIPTDVAHRRLMTPQIPELVGNADIAAMLGVSRQRAAQIAERSDFPPAVQAIKAGPLRVKAQVEAWAQAWERKTGRPVAGGAQ